MWYSVQRLGKFDRDSSMLAGGVCEQQFCTSLYRYRYLSFRQNCSTQVLCFTKLKIALPSVALSVERIKGIQKCLPMQSLHKRCHRRSGQTKNWHRSDPFQAHFRSPEVIWSKLTALKLLFTTFKIIFPEVLRIIEQTKRVYIHL